MPEEDGISIDPVPPPRKEDVLFGPGDDWQTNSCIAQWQAEGYYRSGFRTAAYRLADHVCANGFEQDTLVYPIVYLYRHHTELALKSIALRAVDFLDQQLPTSDNKALRSSHQLSHLWQIVKPLLNQVCVRANSVPLPVDDIEGVEAYIQQIDKHDPDGMRFRYPTISRKKANAGGATDGIYVRSPSLAFGLTLVNVRQLATGMEKLADYLDGIDGRFSDLCEDKAELGRAAAGY